MKPCLVWGHTKTDHNGVNFDHAVGWTRGTDGRWRQSHPPTATLAATPAAIATILFDQAELQVMGLDISGNGVRCVAENCFRLLRLVSEVQNDVEVVKPVLEELEVMRLSCALGMLSSVNAKDFEFEMLEAHEFDEDFARFLRQKIFSGGSADGDEVKLVCLFGTQQEVKRELVRLGSWSDACERNLLARDQGIYCVTKTDEESKERNLILFAWLQDVLFEVQRLRDTATYILRFLTCLSSHVVCCLSAADIERIEEAVKSLSTSEMDEWQSYSVAFHVERQEDAKDAVHCQMLKTMRLPAEAMDADDVSIVKGSYPAIAFVKAAPATTSFKKSKHSFDNTRKLVDWVVDQAKDYKLTIKFDCSRYFELRDLLLKASGFWPTSRLADIENVRCRCTREIDATIREDVKSHIEEQRRKLMAVTDMLFSVDVLDSEHIQEAFAVVATQLDELRNPDVLDRIGEKINTILYLPLRLKASMKLIQKLYTSGMSSELDDFLDKIITTKKSELRHDLTKKNIFARIRHWYYSRNEPNGTSLGFRVRMNTPLKKMKNIWWDNVQKRFEVCAAALPPKWADRRKKSIQATYNRDKSQIVNEAWGLLQQSWETTWMLN